MIRRLKRWWIIGCNKGATALEFALILPVFMLLVMGTLEFGMVAFIHSVLDGATSISSRLGKTGAGGASREALIRTEIVNRSGGLLDPAKLNVTMLSYRSWSNVGQPEPCLVAVCNVSSPPANFTDVNGNGVWDADQGSPTAGAAGDVVLYRVTYEWRIFTPFMRHYFETDDGTYIVSAVATVRNEAFPTP